MSKSRKSRPASEAEIQRTLNLLRQVMRRQKKTQLEVQRVLGWGRSSISQMMTGQKSVRLGQLLDILDALEVPPSSFFAELYALEPPSSVARLDEVTRLEHQVKSLAGQVQDLGQRLADLEEARSRKPPGSELQGRFAQLRHVR